AERAADRGEGVTLRRVFLFQILTLGVVFLALACASHREAPLPTLEDYSDRVSAFTRMYLDDWKAGASDPRFYAEGFAWNGPLPGDELKEMPSRAPLKIAMFTRGLTPGAPSPRPSPGGRGSAELRRRLAEIRGRFAALGRTEEVIFDFHRRGERRELGLGLLLKGQGAEGAYVRAGGSCSE